MAKTSSSSQSTSYVAAQGAGATSSTSTTSPSGETISRQATVFTPGATSSQASASSVDGVVTATAPAEGTAKTLAEDDWLTLEHPPNLVLHIGSPFDDRFSNTDQQDVMIGHTGIDIFELSFDRRETTSRINTVDIIVDFELNADFLQLPDGISVSDLSFELSDLNADTVADSTLIRWGEDGDILAIVLNTIVPVDLEQTDAGSPSQSYSSSQSVVDGSGASSRSEAILTLPNGETVRSVDSIFVPGATSSGAIAISDQVDVPTLVSVPAAVQPFKGQDGLAIDFLLGTPLADRLVGTSDRDIFVGYGGGDTFVLDATGTEYLAEADLIIDFNVAEGDLLQLSSDLSLAADIVLEPVDLDNNGMVESTSVRLTNGNILALVQGITDLPSNVLVTAVNPAE